MLSHGHNQVPPLTGHKFPSIDLLAILRKSLDRALFLYNFIREVRSSGVRGSITIVHIRKFYKLYHNIVRFRFFPRIAKRSISSHVNFDKVRDRNCAKNVYLTSKIVC